MANSSISKIKKVCQVEGCERKHLARGYCSKHYAQIRESVGFPGQNVCSVECCKMPAVTKGFCDRHYTQMRSKGQIYGNPVRTPNHPNEIIVELNICRIVLYNRYGETIAEAIIDKEDLDKVSGRKWCLIGSTHYATSDGMLLHRLIMGLKPNDPPVDHADHDTLNCRKTNLRICSPAQNQWNRIKCSRNTSGYKGVSWHKKDKNWMVRIRKEGNEIYIGSFKNKIVGARAYDQAAIKYFGEFALLNGV